MKRFLFFLSCISPCFAQAPLPQREIPPPARIIEIAPITSSSYVDWTAKLFSSSIELNMEKSGISLPAGKNTAVNKITTQIPTLVKDPLLSINIDSQYQLGDFVLDEKVTLEELSRIIDSGKKHSSVFDTAGQTLHIDHKLSLNTIGMLFIKHHRPYTPPAPVARVPTRAYTGILIDARGLLPVHGEYISAKASPCIFPRIWDDTMELVYERNMMEPNAALARGIVKYEFSDDEESYSGLIGKDPLRITARGLFGKNRTDPIISRNDALKLLSIPENRALFEAGRVVILLEKDTLVHAVSFPEKQDDYYERYSHLKEFIADKQIPDLTARDGPRGVEISIQNLNFIADTATVIPSEQPRLDLIADMLRGFLADQDFTVLVEGHTASTGRPQGEMQLSGERAQAIIDALVLRGIPRDVFTWKGYGGLQPVAENNTEEGRAKNRRVEIVVMPKTIYIQRTRE